MRTIKFIVIIALLVSGCIFDGGSTHLVDDFEVGYTDMKRYTNLNYRSQGVFRGPYCVSETWHDDSVIFVKTLALIDGQLKDDSKADYFVIDIAQYKNDPDQMSSPGVVGPIDQSRFTSMLNSVGESELDYNDWGVR